MNREIQVIALLGSPHRNGNTEQFLDRFLEGARDAGGVSDKVILSRLSYGSCKGCNACHKTGVCVMTDDIPDLYERILAADCFIATSPIYTMGITTELKAFIDRAHYLWVRHYKLGDHTISQEMKRNRRGYFLSTAGMDRPDVFDTAYPMMTALFNILGFTYCRDLLAGNMDGFGGITGHPTALTEAYQTGFDAVRGIAEGVPCTNHKD